LIISDPTGRKLFEKTSDLNNVSATEKRLSWTPSSDFGETNMPAGLYIYAVELKVGAQKTAFSGRLIKY
jgi:hypothetical protein